LAGFVRHLTIRQPSFAAMENVPGLAKRKSTETRTDAQIMIDTVEEKLPQYTGMKYHVNLFYWSPMTRERTILIFAHARVGGQACLHRIYMSLNRIYSEAQDRKVKKTLQQVLDITSAYDRPEALVREPRAINDKRGRPDSVWHLPESRRV
jgi:site-specific DNA-cytosine methylase